MLVRSPFVSARVMTLVLSRVVAEGQDNPLWRRVKVLDYCVEALGDRQALEDFGIVDALLSWIARTEIAILLSPRRALSRRSPDIHTCP
jgi:hypothetical protein